MPTATNDPRRAFTKKATAQIVSKPGRNLPRFPYSIKLMGPSDGSGCLPPGEVKVHQTRFRSTVHKAITEAIEYCDARQIRIDRFPAGFGY